jgi:hypothetical protein
MQTEVRAWKAPPRKFQSSSRAKAASSLHADGFHGAIFSGWTVRRMATSVVPPSGKERRLYRQGLKYYKVEPFRLVTVTFMPFCAIQLLYARP